MKRNIFWTILLVIIFLIDLGWFRQWGWPAYLINFSLLFVVLLTFFEDLPTGLIYTAVICALFALASPLWSWSYWLAFFGAALVATYISRHVFTSRSTISLLATTAAATGVFYIVMILYRYTAAFITHPAILFPVNPLLIAGAIQIICHPLILWGVWIITGANKYAQINDQRPRIF